ncbi:hypothetical protein ABVV53_11875 [Novosphingobium sp. RD2P27]|uniref:Secreted protein n=1 Tax=Novosphingobium kalidii TaxID=3230299 RepID=A0ABV2D2P8_9SPHN
MRYALLIGLLALVPASLNASAAPTMTIVASSCMGAQHAVTIPIAPTAPLQQDGQLCCAKGCHSGKSRKRFLRAP